MDKLVFGKRLQMARSKEGFSLRQLSEKLNNEISHTALSKYEKGEMFPSSNILIKLSKALSVSVDYFFRKITSINLIPNFRKGSGLSKKDQKRIVETTKNILENYIEAAAAAEQNFFYSLPKINVSSINDAVSAAVKIREKLNIGQAPIVDLISELEEASIVVVEVDEVADFSGVCLSGENVAAIAININSDNVRKRFTMAHELGHLILDFVNISDKEKEVCCHAFAGAFLIPPAELKNYIGLKRESIYIDELKTLKEIYGISMQAIAYQLVINNIISARKHTLFKQLITKNSWKIEEPGTFNCTEKPKLIEQLVLRALSKGNLSLSKSAELLGKSQNDLLSMELAF